MELVDMVAPDFTLNNLGKCGICCLRSIVWDLQPESVVCNLLSE